ncbi:sulfotransferase family 2 domain-containing protein [Ningiella sp. W23]|uniref:sulfotransferase family 2 domain-containing protein n=1 Tax=Ningiella sp. W23 TaxID=3023715 RepID=UPI003756361E
MRTVILHYHLFKNAGTSIDAALKEQFTSDKWATKEFPNDKTANAEQLAQWIKDEANIVCFSSHTAHLPVPSIPSVKVIPIFFLRHPIERITSVYAFEKRQTVDTFGTKLARENDIKGYIEGRLSNVHDKQCRNFHCDKLGRVYPPTEHNELIRATQALNAMPFFGLVEEFERSIDKLSRVLQNAGFDHVLLKVKKSNASQSGQLTIADKLSTLKHDIGENLYETLLEANKYDIQLYEYAKRLFAL